MSAIGAAIDPVLLEVLRNRLDAIADEMELTLLRSAASPIVKEGLDASAALFNIEGETIAQAAAIPIHLGALQFAARRIVRAFPPATMRDGDAFLLNDPYDGGTHLPDITLAVPVIAERPRGRARLHHVPPPGRGRPHAGQRAHRRHRALPGRPDHPAHPALPGGRARREPLRAAQAERPPARRVHRRSDGPGRGGPPRRAAAARAVRRPRRRGGARLHRRAARRGRSGSPAGRSRRSPTGTTPSPTISTTTAWTSTGACASR